MDKLSAHERWLKHYLVIAGIIVAGILIYITVTWFFTPPAGDAKKETRETPKTNIQSPPLTPKPAELIPATFIPDASLPPITNGLAPVITTVPTKQKVVFLGIDDGAFKDPSVVEIIKQNHIKASLFLSRAFISNNPDFFKQITALGSVVENHTLAHDTKMTIHQSYAQQKNEICGMADYELQHYGHRPTLFRPPGGAYSTTMRKAAADCGMKAIVTWIAKANGGSMQYQIGHTLRPGDVVLMHFRPEFKQDMQAFINAEAAAGLHTELLEDIPSAG